MTNNNMDKEIGLVTEFLNIWSDFEKFSKRKEISTSQVRVSSSDCNENRFNKRLKCLDNRDLDENLFIDYVGSYTVKKSSKDRGRPWSRSSKHNKLRESSKKPFELPIVDLEESVGKFEDQEIKVPPCESKDKTLNKSNNNVDIEKETQSLVDFLKQHNILDSKVMGTESVELSVPQLNDEESLYDINGNEIAIVPYDYVTEEIPLHGDDNIDIEVMPLHIDDDLDIPLDVDANNNPMTMQLPNIIDITGSDSDSFLSNDEHDDVEISRNIAHLDLGFNDYKHPLEFSWTFWYFTPKPGKSWSENLELLATVSTVEDFWSVINWINAPSEMKTGVDFSMFKEGIFPDWSDIHNEEGGRYVVKFAKEEIDEYWTEMLMALIGQVLCDGDCMDKVNKLTKLKLKLINNENKFR